jgi:hypothetical protein
VALNYLQRLAVAGSRTAAPARPPRLAPVQMPAPPSFADPLLQTQRPTRLPYPTEDLPQARLPRQLESVPEPQPGPFEPTPGTLKAFDADQMPGESSSAGKSCVIEPLASDPSSPGSASLPTQEPVRQMDIRPQQKPRSDYVIRAPKGLRPDLPASPSAEGPKPSPIGRPPPKASATAAPQAPARISPAAEPLPETARRGDDLVAAQSHPGPVEPEFTSGFAQATAESSGPAEAARPAISSREMRSPTDKGDSPVIQTPAARIQPALSAGEPSQPGLAPKSLPPPVMPALEPASARSESRITIGRVDVHVNSRVAQSPQVPKRGAVKATAVPSSTLEAHYLGRFSLRP